jgi:hypothetical protein
MSWHLSPRGRQHLVLERDRIAKRWRIQRWTLCFQFFELGPVLRRDAHSGADAARRGLAGDANIAVAG